MLQWKAASPVVPGQGTDATLQGHQSPKSGESKSRTSLPTGCPTGIALEEPSIQHSRWASLLLESLMHPRESPGQALDGHCLTGTGAGK